MIRDFVSNQEISEIVLLLIGAVVVLFLVVEICTSIVAMTQKFMFPYPLTKFGFRGKLVYMDKGKHSNVFLSDQYQLAAKPDFVFKTSLFRYALIEYKSTYGKVKQEHINQAKAATIAVRQNVVGKRYNIKDIFIVTQGETVRLTARSNASLFKDIKSKHRSVLRAKKGHMHNRIYGSHCHGCAYKDVCEDS